MSVGGVKTTRKKTSQKKKKTSRKETSSRKKTSLRKKTSRPGKRAAEQSSLQSQQLQIRTVDDIRNEQTVEQLALRIWAALVGERALSTMAGLLDELLDAHLLDDSDDEEVTDEVWLADHRKHEDKLLDEAITDGLDKYPDIDAINKLPPLLDSDIARDVEQLREALKKCAIGATQFANKFPRTILEGMVKRDIKERFKKNPEYGRHVRTDVPGSDIKKYGLLGCTSSAGTFVKATSEYGGVLVTLLTGGWMRVAKDRIDPVAWSHRFGFDRKTEKQRWLHHYRITERSGKQSIFKLKRETLHGTGSDAIKQLLRSGVHINKRKIAKRGLVSFLDWKPRREIARMPYVGFFKVDGGHYICVRSNETLLPRALRGLKDVVYEVDDASDPDHYGHQIKGTTELWQDKVAIPLCGNSNVALAFGIGFASALIPFADEQRGGEHLYGTSGWGKSAILAAKESIYGLPSASEHRHSYGRTWATTSTGLEDLLAFRNHASFSLDDIHRVPHALRGNVILIVYEFSQAPKTRGGAWRLRGADIGQCFLLSAGEVSIAVFVGKDIDRGGRERRMPDIPAEVYPGAKSAFETIDHDALPEKLPALYSAMLYECHGAAGRDWQMWLVERLAELGVEKIKERINQERQIFLALPQVRDIWHRTQPELRSIIRRFSLYAAALHLAIEANILPSPWTSEEADTGLVACLRRWVQRNTDPVIMRLQFVADFKRKLADDLAGRFIHLRKVKGHIVPATDSDIAKHAEQQNSPAAYDGYVKDGFVLIRPEAFVKRCVGADHAEEIAKYLHANGELVGDKDGKYSKTVQTIGRSERLYVVPQAALALGEDTPDTSDTSDPEK